MATYRAGKIVLIAFPYSDAIGAKQRPALILSDVGDADVIAARITSQPYDTPFDVTLHDWRRAGLVLPSVVRDHKIATLEKLLIRRTLGALTIADWDAVRARVQRLWRLL